MDSLFLLYANTAQSTAIATATTTINVTDDIYDR